MNITTITSNRDPSASSSCSDPTPLASTTATTATVTKTPPTCTCGLEGTTRIIGGEQSMVGVLFYCSWSKSDIFRQENIHGSCPWIIWTKMGQNFSFALQLWLLLTGRLLQLTASTNPTPIIRKTFYLYLASLTCQAPQIAITGKGDLYS